MVEEHVENIQVPSLSIYQEHLGDMYGKQFECYWWLLVEVISRLHSKWTKNVPRPTYYCTTQDPWKKSSWTQWCDIVTCQWDHIRLNARSDALEMWGLDVARVHWFFSFKVGDGHFSYTLIHHFYKPFDNPNLSNGMWIIGPNFNGGKYRAMSVVCMDSIVCAAYLFPPLEVM